MNLPEELQNLATLLTQWGDKAEAKARELVAKGGDEAKGCLKFMEQCRYFKDVCEQGASKLRSKEKAGRFIAPTFPEVIQYCREHKTLRFWPTDDVRAWWNHFEANGWRVGGKTPMKSWHSAAENGYRNYSLKNPNRIHSPNGNGHDPDGWREWIIDTKGRYKPFREAHAYERTDFQKSRGGEGI